MIEKYLEEATYAYKIHSEFIKDGIRHVVVSEFTPQGEESGMYVLFQVGDKIYNQEDELVATIVNKIEFAQ